MIWETRARSTRRRLIRPRRYNGRPKAAMDALAITVLSRSKNAALIRSVSHYRPSVSHQQLLHHILGVRGDQHEDLVADGRPGSAPGDDEMVVTHHRHDGGIPGHPEVDQRYPGRRRVVGQGDL